MLASDPRWRDYNLLQLELCALTNLSCHWNTARLPLDARGWWYGHGDEDPGREVVARALKQAMTTILSGGLDDVPLPKDRT